MKSSNAGKHAVTSGLCKKKGPRMIIKQEKYYDQIGALS